MADDFANHAQGLDSPGGRHASVTPDDDNDLDPTPRALYIGGGGAVAMHDRDGTSVTWAAVPVGAILPFRARRVLATGTTATNIVAIW